MKSMKSLKHASAGHIYQIWQNNPKRYELLCIYNMIDGLSFSIVQMWKWFKKEKHAFIVIKKEVLKGIKREV